VIATAVSGSVSMTEIIVACIALGGVLITSGGLIVREVIKMKRSNTYEHGEVVTMVKTVIIGQDQLCKVVERHIEQHEDLPK
tara:strand:- start:14 stop:259 length:246 start_codon:yes stop_codon:yes gene_type:complete